MDQPTIYGADFDFEIDDLEDPQIEVVEELNDVLLPRGGPGPSARCN
jgi:hypothetical protein